MNKVFVFAVLLTLSVPAISAVRCVNGGTIEPDGEFTSRVPDWEWYQADMGAARFRGLAMCSDLDPLNNETVDYITQSATLSKNFFCYCKLITPMVSKWVSMGALSDCVIACPENCVNG